MQLSIARFSRQQEFEADQIGIGVIAKAGYDPYAASRFLTSLGRWSALRTAMIGAGSADKPDMMATHPSTPERVAQAVVEARKFGAPGAGETGRDDYLYVDRRHRLWRQSGRGAGARHALPPSQARLRLLRARRLHAREPVGGADRRRRRRRAGAAARLIALSPSTSLEDELASGWIDGVKTVVDRGAAGGDYPMAIAVAQGDQWSFRLGAVRVGDRVFRLIFAAHPLTPAVDARFRASIRSFHRLRPEEAAEAQALRAARGRGAGRATAPSRWRSACRRRSARSASSWCSTASTAKGRWSPASATRSSRRERSARRAPAERPARRRHPQQAASSPNSTTCSRRAGSRWSAPARSASPSRRRPATASPPTRR